MALTKVKAGNILLTTPGASSNDVTPATTAYVTTALANLADSAPSTLDTLNELAAALGDDANFSTTVTNSIAAKLPLSGGTMTGAITGNLIGNVTGNVSGTALTVTQAAQPAITSLGTLTTLTVDDITINGSAITVGAFGNTARAANFHGGSILVDGGAASEIIIGDGNIAYMSIQTTDNATAMKIRDFTGSADLVTIERATGNVGIGETSPSAPLDIAATSAGIELQTTNNTSYGYLNFGDPQDNNIGQILYDHASNYMRFQVNNAERWRINSSGHFTPNQQHTQDIGGVNAEVKDIYAQGLYVGGSAAANKLDDYEEGTWTPAIYTYSGVTTSSISTYGTYTKIGNICHIHAKITVTLSSLPGQVVTITGLPFTAKDSGDTQQRAIMAIGGDTANTGGYTPKAHFRTSGSELKGIFWNASNNTAYWYYNSFDSPTFEIHIHGHYTTT